MATERFGGQPVEDSSKSLTQMADNVLKITTPKAELALPVKKF